MSSERAGMRGWGCQRWLTVLAAASLALGSSAAAPGGSLRAQTPTCEVNNQASCTAGGTAAFSINVTITTAALVTTPTSLISFPVPTSDDFALGSGPATGVTFAVRANTSWALAVSSSAGTWTGSPASARQNKPRSDLEWSTAAGGSYTGVTASPAAFASGGAMGTILAGVPQTLWLRVRWTWLQDTPGTYTIPVTVTLTAP